MKKHEVKLEWPPKATFKLAILESRDLLPDARAACIAWQQTGAFL